MPGSFSANTPDAAGHGQDVLLAVEQLAEVLNLGAAAGRESGTCIRLQETLSAWEFGQSLTDEAAEQLISITRSSRD